MYPSLRLPWSPSPSGRETAYRAHGLVKTRGTLYLLPPPATTLRDTFNAPPRPKTRMSSGAVALCKHFERGGASSEKGVMHPFWTLPQGSNEEKTSTAAGILERMLHEAAWRNVMLLHSGVAVYEIRNPRGFGMRWTLDIVEKDAGAAAEGEGRTGSDPTAEAGEAEEMEEVEEAERAWEVKRTTFRGFLEPIEGLDHELPRSAESAAGNG